MNRKGDDIAFLETVALSKTYPGVRALDGVDFQLRRGEVHILFGENGAGKSTLISLLAGANQPSGGEIRFEGKAVALASVHHARDLGISAVFQEFSLIPQMTVAENIMLGAEQSRCGILQPQLQRKKVEGILESLDFHLGPDQRVDRLSRAEQQMVEIAKAFRSDLNVLILDEPTASLTHHEVEQLFCIIARLKEKGVGIIYITHRMAEIQEIGDRITILRDGKLIATRDAKTSSQEELVQLMTGREVGRIFPAIQFNPAETVLQAENLTSADGGVMDVSLSVKRGEIVGLAGLIGSGKSRCGQACFGAVPLREGRIHFKGQAFSNPSPRRMIENGLLYLPSDRRQEGLMMMRPARENISIASLQKEPFSNGVFLSRKGEARAVREHADRLKLVPNRIDRTAEHFSGGNQQKLMLARSLAQRFDAVIFDEPTVGVDVGTRVAIYAFIKELCENGAGIVLISSDMSEILNLTRRVYVFYRGRVQVELRGGDINETNILSHFFEKQAA